MNTINQIFWPFTDKKLDDIPIFKKNTKKTKDFCKEHNYDYKMWSLKDCEELIIEKYPEYICLWQEFRFDIQKCDFIRYLILHSEGGWYVDCDVYPIQNLQTLNEFDHLFTTWSNDLLKRPYNAVMKSFQGNPLMIEIANEVQIRVIEKQAIKIYDAWKGRLVFQTTGHHMLKKLVPKKDIHDIMLISNSEKNIYITSPNPYFFDENITSWWCSQKK